MTSRVGRTTLTLVVVLVLVGVAWLSMNRVPAQTPAATTSSLPRTADGKPDISGIWQVLNTAAWNIQDHSAAKGVPAGQAVVEGNELPYLPEALAKRNENFKNRLTADPETKCFQPGVPRIMYMPFPFQIIQTPTYIGMLFEYERPSSHPLEQRASRRADRMGARRFSWALGRGHPCRRRHLFQRRHMVRSRRQFSQ